MAGTPFKGKQVEVDDFTVRVAEKTTGKPPRRGVTILRGDQPVGRAALYGEELRIHSLNGLSKRGLLDALGECGVIKRAPKPKPVPKPEVPKRAPKAAGSD